MSGNEAKIIRLDEFRRRREEAQGKTAQPAVPPIVWFPVWVWVPVLPLP
jgi:hypothetical protein